MTIPLPKSAESPIMPNGQRTFLVDSRVLVWFSCGAASAVAAKIAVEAYPDCEVIYCNLFANEDSDNPRFLADVEKWIGRKITILSSDRFKTCEEVWESQGFLKNQFGAPCTKFLKRYVREAYQHLEDRHVFGYTHDEQDRIEEFETHNPNLKAILILDEKKITKQECYQILQTAGLTLPAMYHRGYKNNNCIGCVKGGGGRLLEQNPRGLPQSLCRSRRLREEDRIRAFEDQKEAVFSGRTTAGCWPLRVRKRDQLRA